MTEEQAGGSKGKATSDHILTLKELIQISKQKKSKQTYITFLDVTKAYDKAWLDGIMYVMDKQGIKDETWLLIKELNTNLTAKIKTKDGLTRPITINNSIRQGGVLSGLQYALLMDEISKNIKKANLGIQVPNTQTKIGCLLWMDDVALITNNREEMQQMLDITDTTAKKYHIMFGEEKSKVLKLGKQNQETQFKLGDIKLEYTEKYRYLGITLNHKNNMTEQIKEITGKTEAAFQTILHLARDKNFKGIGMEVILKLVEICIEPIILYSAETWQLNKKETKELNRILENIIKRILLTPTTTPREVIYMETGTISTEYMAMEKRIMYKNKLKYQENSLQKTLTEKNIGKGWTKTTNTMIKELHIEEDELQESKNTTKTIVKEKINQTFKTHRNNRKGKT